MQFANIIMKPVNALLMVAGKAILSWVSLSGQAIHPLKGGERLISACYDQRSES